MKIRPYSASVLVRDARRAAQWYTKKLGLEIVDGDEHWIVVGDRKRGLGLHLCELKGRGGRPMLEPGNTGILLVVDGDIKKAYAGLRKKGVEFTEPLQMTEGGWRCQFRDPDGNVLWLTPS
ncbi:MAG: VOC family protein [Thermoplasmata archaeon]